MKYKIPLKVPKALCFAGIQLCLGAFATIGALNLFAEGITDRLNPLLSLLIMLFGVVGAFMITFAMYYEAEDSIEPDADFDFEREAINQKAQQLLDEAKELGRK